MGKKLCEKDSKVKISPEGKKYVCKKCGLKADKEKKLCKPFKG